MKDPQWIKLCHNRAMVMLCCQQIFKRKLKLLFINKPTEQVTSLKIHATLQFKPHQLLKISKRSKK